MTDRQQARTLAANQASSLRTRLRQCIEAAYGISEEPRDGIVLAIDRADQFASLQPTFAPQRPVGANLKEALEKLLDQALGHQFPAHPSFDAEIKTGSIKKVWAEIERATAEPGERALVADKATRQLVRAIANPLRLGEMGETHLHLHEFWKSHFLQCHAREAGVITVGRLRQWLDEPQPRGLPAEAQNLVILTFAAQTNRAFRLRGGPAQPAIENLPDELELVEEALPDRGEWREAVRRMSALFGKRAAGNAERRPRGAAAGGARGAGCNAQDDGREPRRLVVGEARRPGRRSEQGGAAAHGARRARGACERRRQRRRGGCPCPGDCGPRDLGGGDGANAGPSARAGRDGPEPSATRSSTR